MRRLSLLTLLLLAASGARGQTAPLAERIVGDWANTDSMSVTIYDENGDEIVGEDGSLGFVTLHLHLAITASEITSTVVSRSEGELQGLESTASYVLCGDSLYSESEPPVGVAVRNDSLVLSRPESGGTGTDYVLVRAAPLRPPEALLGDWITAEMTDDAGVVFDLPFRFHADGTYLTGHSGPLAYRVLGPYLLTYESEFELVPGTMMTWFQVVEMELELGRALTIQVPGQESLVLYRR